MITNRPTTGLMHIHLKISDQSRYLLHMLWMRLVDFTTARARAFTLLCESGSGKSNQIKSLTGRGKKKIAGKVLAINRNPKADWIFREPQNNPEVNWKPTSCCAREPAASQRGHGQKKKKEKRKKPTNFLLLLVSCKPCLLIASDAISIQQTLWKHSHRLAIRQERFTAFSLTLRWP